MMAQRRGAQPDYALPRRATATRFIMPLRAARGGGYRSIRHVSARYGVTACSGDVSHEWRLADVTQALL